MQEINEVQTVIPDRLYGMLHLLKAAVNAGEITIEVAQIAAVQLTTKYQTEVIYLW